MFQQDLRAQTYAILESLHLEKRAGTETQRKKELVDMGRAGCEVGTHVYTQLIHAAARRDPHSIVKQSHSTWKLTHSLRP